MWEKSTTDILLQTPFIGRVLMALPMIEDNSRPTMSTNGSQIAYNREFCESLTPAERDGARVHECLHILMGHHVRRGERDPARWNIAADYEINPIVLAAGYALPSGTLLDEAYADMSAEEIYERLPEDISAPTWGIVHDGEGTPEEMRDAWRKLSASVNWGDLPGGLARKISENLEPKPGLAELLAPLLSSLIPVDDETWLPPSRRNSLLPSYEMNPAGYVVACVDTSGSIDMAQLTEFAEVILGIAGIGRIDIIFGDAEVCAVVEEVGTTDEIIAAFSKAKGGGGTDFRPLLAEAARREPDGVVYLTDGFGSFGSPVDVPVLWLMNSEAESPWGTVLRIDSL